jgi:mismatch-specific thymine-DNA glycosylase
MATAIAIFSYNTVVVKPATGNAITLSVDGREFRTLRDLLPESPGLNILFVGKTPAPESVQKGHYFQGKQGCSFWRMLRQYRILGPTTEFEDDTLLQHGYGLTDIAKEPRPFGHEPSPEEYQAGARRILGHIRVHRPKLTVFVYKRVLDRIIQFEFAIRKRASYGFNQHLERYFGCKVFAFPLPGTSCTKELAKAAMEDLATVCREFTNRN